MCIWNPLTDGLTSWSVDPSFFHGELADAEAAMQLRAAGDFLVRYKPGTDQLVLSVRNQHGHVLHTLLAQDGTMVASLASARQPGQTLNQCCHSSAVLHTFPMGPSVPVLSFSF